MLLQTVPPPTDLFNEKPHHQIRKFSWDIYALSLQKAQYLPLSLDGWKRTIIKDDNKEVGITLHKDNEEIRIYEDTSREFANLPPGIVVSRSISTQVQSSDDSPFLTLPGIAGKNIQYPATMKDTYSMNIDDDGIAVRVATHRWEVENHPESRVKLTVRYAKDEDSWYTKRENQSITVDTRVGPTYIWGEMCPTTRFGIGNGMFVTQNDPKFTIGVDGVGGKGYSDSDIFRALFNDPAYCCEYSNHTDRESNALHEHIRSVFGLLFGKKDANLENMSYENVSSAMYSKTLQWLTAPSLNLQHV